MLTKTTTKTKTSSFGLGLIGVGGFGDFCLDAYAGMDELAVVAVADIDLARAQRSAPPGAAVYEDYHALLADPQVQIVAVNTPPFLHGRMVAGAAAAGKHIFVEKPLATSIEEAEAAVAAVRRAGVHLGINYVLRHHPLHRLAATLIHRRTFGEFPHFSLENFAADDNLLPDHWFWDTAKSGGIHVEHGVHFFDLCNHLVGAAPDHVTGLAQRRADGRVDRVTATIRYGERVLATFYHSFNHVGRIEQTTIRLNCTRGHLLLEGWIPTRLTLTGLVDEAGLAALASRLGEQLQIVESYQGSAATVNHGGATEQLAALVTARVEAPDRQLEYRRAIQAGMRDLTQAIHQGRPPQVGADDALRSLVVALRATG